MFNTTFEGGNLKITIDDSLKKQLIQQGINPEEVYRLIESFANKLLNSKYIGEFFLENEDTGTNLRLNLSWETETEALIHITDMDMKKVKPGRVPNIPQGAKFDFNQLNLDKA